MQSRACVGALVLTMTVTLLARVEAEELIIEKRLQEVMTTQFDLTACGDIAHTYQNDEQSAEIYNDLSFRLLDKAEKVGWTSEDLAIASVLVMENRTDIVVKEDDTLEDYRLRNYTGERCERQVVAAQEYLAGSFPSP